MKTIPKNFEVRRAFCRQILQRRLLREGPTPSLCRKIRRLETVCCLSGNGQTLPVDASLFFEELFGALYVALLEKQKLLLAHLSAEGVRELPLRALELLLCRMVLKNRQAITCLSVESSKNTIKILLFGVVADPISKQIARQNGLVCLCDPRRHVTGIFLSAKRLAHRGFSVDTAATLLRNPLSPVNLFRWP